MKWLWAFLLFLSFAAPAQGASINLPYSGRLVEETGKPIAGPVDLEIQFFASIDGGDSLSDVFSFPLVTLQEGVFQVNLELLPPEYHQIFKDVGQQVWIQITDATNGSVYPRQLLAATPYALKVPVDGETIAFDSNGLLQVVSGEGAGQVVTLGSGGKLPGVDGSKLTKVKASEIGGKSSTEVANAVAEVATASSSGEPGAIVKTDSSGQIRTTGVVLPDNDTNTVTLKANNDLTSTHTYTLPPAPSGGDFLTTDAGGNLSWAAIGGGGDMLRATYDIDGDNLVDGARFVGGIAPAPAVVAEGGSLSAVDTTLTVGSTAGFPTQGVLIINDELIGYNGTTGTDFQNLIRGAHNTTAGIHADGTNATLVSVASVSSGNKPNVYMTQDSLNFKDGSLVFYDDDSSNTIGFTAPSNATTSEQYTLPPTDGTSGDVLTTNGSGTLTWSTPHDSTTVQKTGNGTAALPSYTYDSDLSTGMWLNGGALGFSVGGVQTVQINGVGGSHELHIQGGGAAISSMVEATDASNAAMRVKNSAGDYGWRTAGGHFEAYDYAAGTSRIFVEGTTGEVGIGVTPSAKLHVGGDGNFDVIDGSNMVAISSPAGQPGITGLSPNRRDIRFDDTGISLLTKNDGTQPAATNGLIINEDGNVGIGTTNPGGKLEIAQTSGTDYFKISRSGMHNWGVSSSNNGTNDALYFVNVTDTTIPVAIDSNGNVGIGTTAPTKKLEIKGGNGNQFALDNAGEVYTSMEFKNNGTQKASFQWYDTTNKFNIINSQAGTLGLYTSNLERLTIGSSGNVGIGTTNPLNQFEVVSTGTSAVQLLESTSSVLRFLSFNDGTNWIQSGVDRTGGSAADLKFSNMNGTVTHMVVKDDGDVGIGTDNPNYKLGVNGDIGVSGDNAFVARYNNSEDHRALLQWQGLQLGNNGANYIVAGNTIVGADLHLVVNNTNDLDGDPSAHNGTTALSLIDTGNVGVGTTNPLFKFHIRDDRDESYIPTTEPTASLYINNNTQGTNELTSLKFGSRTFNGGTAEWYLNTVGENNFDGFFTIQQDKNGTATERLRIDTNGDVGIGTTNPTARLMVQSSPNVSISSDTVGASVLADFVDGNAYLGFSRSFDGSETISGLYSYNNTVTDTTPNLVMATRGDLVMATGGGSGMTSSLEALRIDSTGRVGVGTTTPTNKLHVSGSLGLNTTTITGNTVLDSTHNVVLVNNTGAVTIDLPSAVSSTDRSYILKKISTNNDEVTIDANGADLIDGAATLKFFVEGDMVRIISDGTNWHVIDDGLKAHMAKMTRDVTQAILNSTKFNFDNVVFDNAGIADATTNHRFDIKRDGKYLVTGSWYVDVNTLNKQIQVLVNGVYVEQVISLEAVGRDARVVSSVLDLSAGDYVEIQGFSDTSVNTTTSHSQPKATLRELR